MGTNTKCKDRSLEDKLDLIIIQNEKILKQTKKIREALLKSQNKSAPSKAVEDFINKFIDDPF